MNLYYSELLQIIEDKDRLKRCVLKVMKESAALDPPPKHNKLEINGLPEEKYENLKRLFNRLSKVIKCEVPIYDIVQIGRIHKRSPRPILVHVRDRSTRDRILYAAAKFNERYPTRPLNSTDIILSFASERHRRPEQYRSAVFVSKHPSPLNKIHRQQAWQEFEERNKVFKVPAIPAPVKTTTKTAKPYNTEKSTHKVQCKSKKQSSVECKGEKTIAIKSLSALSLAVLNKANITPKF